MAYVLLKNCRLIDETGEISSGEDLLIQDGVIAGRGKSLAPLEGETGEILDCGRLFVSPGLTILHAHSPMHILRGIAEDVNVDDWFNKEIWPYESKILEEDIYWGAKLCCAEMLDHGVTAFADHYFHGEQIAKAAKESGIRADIAGTVFAFDGNPEPEMRPVEALMEQYRDDPLVKIRFGPHSPYICSPEVLRTLVEAAREKGGGIHLHVSETERQVAESREKHGKTPFQVVAEAGGFTVPCIVAHGLWIEDGDLPLLGEDTYIALCPKTYMKLGAGRGPIWESWRKVNLCIGTDGAASSNSVDPLEQARLFALLGKLTDQAEDLVKSYNAMKNSSDPPGGLAGDDAGTSGAELRLRQPHPWGSRGPLLLGPGYPPDRPTLRPSGGDPLQCGQPEHPPRDGGRGVLQAGRDPGLRYRPHPGKRRPVRQGDYHSGQRCQQAALLSCLLFLLAKEEKEAKRRTAKVFERRMGSKSQCFTPVGCFSS